MATTNFCWRVRWKYQVAGKLLEPLNAADFIVTALTPGPDGTIRPDLADLNTRITNNFFIPSGATIVLQGVSSSQTPAVYS